MQVMLSACDILFPLRERISDADFPCLVKGDGPQIDRPGNQMGLQISIVEHTHITHTYEWNGKVNETGTEPGIEAINRVI